MIYSEDIQQFSGSTVLLLIIPNPTSTLLTHSLFYRLFAPYGEVEKILIFEKSRIWKAFVEMSNEEAAKRAQENLNGTTVMGGGTMNVQHLSSRQRYFSTFKTVTLVNNNSGGVDYRQLKQRMQQKASYRQDVLSVHSQPESYNGLAGLPYYNQAHYPTVQQAYSTCSDEQRPRSGTQEDFRFMSESAQPQSMHQDTCEDTPPLDQHRSRSSTQQTETTANTVRKRLRLRKDDSSLLDQRKAKTVVVHQNKLEKSSSLELLLMEEKQSVQVLNSPQNSIWLSDAENPANLRQLTQEDDCLFDLIKFNENEDQKEDPDEQMDELQLQEDRDIMNAFSTDRQFNFMFSIPEVQVESSSPLAKSRRSRRLQDLQFPDIQPFDATSQQQQHFEQYPMDPAQYVNPQFLLENQPSKVIYIRGLQHPCLTPKHMFNLFSNCGNIMVIIFIRHKHSALIQFQQLSHAQNAKDHLNNLPFYSSKLKIFYSNYQEIQLPLPHSSPLTQIYIPSSEQYRFGEGRNLVFNPPGQVLHISNIQKEATHSEQHLKEIFKHYGSILQVKFMHVQKSKHMALIKMGSLEEALNAAAGLHGYDLLGRSINISFTKSKL